MSILIEILHLIGKKRLIIICSCILIVIAGISAVSIAKHQGLEKCTFHFYTSTYDKMVYEKRYLPRADTMEKSIGQYVKELILGSMARECISFFPPTVTLQSCFVRGDTLYVNILMAGKNMADDAEFHEKCMLFEKNIFTNYKKVARIYMYIDGNSVYDSENPVTEDAVDMLLHRLKVVK